MQPAILATALFPLAVAEDAHADLTLSVLFLVALIATVLGYHAPRRIAHLADYFAPLGLPLGRRGLFAWFLDGRYRNVAIKIECGSTVRGSGPFALVATVRYSQPLRVNPATLLPAQTPVFNATDDQLCFRLPEELYEKKSELEPLGLLNRLVELDPGCDGVAAEPGLEPYRCGPLHPWNLLISTTAAAAAMYCAAAVSFFAAAGVLTAALLAAVFVSNRRRLPGTDLARRAWAVQTALVLALGILGCGLCFTRFGTLSLRDFEPRPVGTTVEIPHEEVRLSLQRQLERGQGQLGPGGKILGNSLRWSVRDNRDRELESGHMTLPLADFDWIAPSWDDGRKHFVLGIVREAYGYKALALLPIFADGGGPPATPAPNEPAHLGPDGFTVYRYWVVAKIDVPPNSPLDTILQERARRDEKARQQALAGASPSPAAP